MFDYLTGRLRQLGIYQKDLMEPLHLRSVGAVSHRFSGRKSWSLDEMYTLLDICGADYSELHLYFPKDGKAWPKGGRRIA